MHTVYLPERPQLKSSTVYQKEKIEKQKRFGQFLAKQRKMEK